MKIMSADDRLLFREKVQQIAGPGHEIAGTGYVTVQLALIGASHG